MIATKVEFAFGADITANPATWTWTDVSIYARGQVSVRGGQADEASTTQPTTCSLRLANNDSRFTPRHPLGAYYPNARRNTPVRVSLNPGSGYTQRFQGYVDTFTPVWLFGNSTQAEVNVTASSMLRRLQQGSSPLRSPLARWHLKAGGAAAFWSLDDASNASSAGSQTGAGTPLMPAGAVGFGQTSTLGGTSAVVTVAPGASMAGTINGVAGTGFIAFDLWVKLFTTSPTNTQNYIATVGMSGGVPLGRLVAINGTPGPAGFQFVFTDTTAGLWTLDSGIGSPGSAVNPYDGNWHNVFVTMTQSGGNINTALFVDGASADSRTITGFTLGAPIAASLINQNSLGDTGTATFAALALNTTSSATSSYTAGLGYAGETATARLSRLCGEEKIPVTITGTSDVLMGVQPADTLINLLRQCETADQGILYDGAGPGLSYFARPSRYNQSVSLALDCNLHQVKLPFAPVEDDQRVRNDWTVTRLGGSFYRVTDPVHIAANGTYIDSVTANLQADSMLRDHANWRLHLSTVEEMRVPEITFDPLHNPELQTSWLAATLGERVTATNLPTQYPPGTLDLIVEGYTETWNQVTWNVGLTSSAYRPWEAFSIEDSRLGRIETDGSTLSSSATSGATSLSVASGGLIWSTSAGTFDIEIEGEQITVTAISGSSSPQTFTVTRSVNGVVKAHNSGATVKLWKPGVLAL